MSLRRSVAGVLWMFLVVVPSWGQTVEVKYDPSTDFRGYKTYAWQERKLLTQQGREAQKEIDQALVDAFNAQLKAKGFTENPSSPDLYLTYTGGSIIADSKSGHGYSPLTSPPEACRGRGPTTRFPGPCQTCGSRCGECSSWRLPTPKRKRSCGATLSGRK